jgi:hypothetical protein
MAKEFEYKLKKSNRRSAFDAGQKDRNRSYEGDGLPHHRNDEASPTSTADFCRFQKALPVKVLLITREIYRENPQNYHKSPKSPKFQNALNGEWN